MNNIVARIKSEMAVSNKVKQFLTESAIKNNYNNEVQRTVKPIQQSKLFEQYDEFS